MLGHWLRKRGQVDGSRGHASKVPTPRVDQEPASPKGVVSVALLVRTVLTGWVVLASGLVGPTGAVTSQDPAGKSKYLWTALIPQAERLKLPTRFLRVIPPNFFTLEFADLHTFAAEYHPEAHRMILSRALSFNAAGGVLRPLGRMTSREVATLYHELFHAYMDYVSSATDLSAVAPDAARLLAFARAQQQCRYQSVSITPLPQKKTMTEPRFLSERESWEALNETWAVFVGWTIWAKLELARDGKGLGRHGSEGRAGLAILLQKADEGSDLVGYYEPEDENERAVTQKRYLAPSNRISPGEVSILMEVLFGETPQEAGRMSSVMVPGRRAPGGETICAQ